MNYVALLRGINVGGNSKVEMARLKEAFEELGYKNVRTYINSGNVIFSTTENPVTTRKKIEKTIEDTFGFYVKVVLRDESNLKSLNTNIPASWVNDSTMKTDIMFLWEDFDKPGILQELSIKPGIDDVRYLSGAIVWQVDRKNVTKSGLLKIIGTPLYKHMTVRNVNTLRKLVGLLESLSP